MVIGYQCRPKVPCKLRKLYNAIHHKVDQILKNISKLDLRESYEEVYYDVFQKLETYAICKLSGNHHARPSRFHLFLTVKFEKTIQIKIQIQILSLDLVVTRVYWNKIMNSYTTITISSKIPPSHPVRYYIIIYHYIITSSIIPSFTVFRNSDWDSTYWKGTWP